MTPAAPFATVKGNIMTDGMTPIEAEPPELDMNRLPYEIMRALNANFVLAEGLDPGLFVKPDPETREVVVMQNGEELARIPRYRLQRPDPEVLRKAAGEALKNVPSHIADQCIAAINSGRFVLDEPPDQDFVAVTVEIGPQNGVSLFKAHRQVVVPEWPNE
jgi:hypothetical protein